MYRSGDAKTLAETLPHKDRLKNEPRQEVFLFCKTGARTLGAFYFTRRPDASTREEALLSRIKRSHQPENDSVFGATRIKANLLILPDTVAKSCNRALDR